MVFPRRHELTNRGWFMCTALVGAIVPINAIQERPDPVKEMQSYVERFTGPQPADCGRHLLKRPERPGDWVSADEDTLRQSVACGVAAAGERKPFWTFTQGQGIDSWVAQGLLGTVEGIVYRFSYDSAPCGGPGCPARISFERCAKPAVATSRWMTEFRCLR